jgi:hypothetical protein
VGIPGILAYFWMLASVIRRARFALRNTVSRRTVLFGRGFLALAIVFFLTSLNGWPLDVPPSNALFWMIGGIALTMHRMTPSLQIDVQAPPPERNAVVSKPAPLSNAA